MGDAEIIPIGTRGRPAAAPAASRRRRPAAWRGRPPAEAGRTNRETAPPRAPSGRLPTTEPSRHDRGRRAALRVDRRRDPRLTATRRSAASPWATGWRRSSGRPARSSASSGSRSSRRFLAFLRRRVTGDYEVDEFGFDPEVTERFLLAALRPIAEKWFRVEVRGVENIPAEGGALMVSNHSGTVPVDGLMTMVSVHDHTGRYLRPLGADLVFRMPFVGELARKGGATLACNEDAERMLSGGELVGVWPEGFKGIGKPYSRALQAAAVRPRRLRLRGAPHRRPDRALLGGRRRGDLPAGRQRAGAGPAARVPYIPITPFFPLLGPLGMVPLPSKWLIEFGEPIRTDATTRARPTTRCWSSTSPTRCGRPSSRRSTPLLMQRESVWRLNATASRKTVVERAVREDEPATAARAG